MLCVLHDGDFHQRRICIWTTQLKVPAWSKVLALTIRLEDKLIQVCFSAWYSGIAFRTIKDLSSINPKCNACSNYQCCRIFWVMVLLYANVITTVDNICAGSGETRRQRASINRKKKEFSESSLPLNFSSNTHA